MNLFKIEPLEARIAPATLSIGDVTVLEGIAGPTTATFTVTLSEAATEEFTVSFTTTDGTAVSTGAFADFVAQTGTLTFGVGEQSKDISIEVTGDVFDEADQTFTVTLSNPTGSNSLSDGSATGTITDDDAAATLTITPAADVTEGASVSSVFNVTLSHAVETPVVVNFATGNASDTAKPAPGAFTDYLAQSGTLTFAAGGAVTQQISVAITDDTFKEDTEQFTVTLSGATGATIATSSAIGKILNDADTIVGLTLPDVKVVEGSGSNSQVVRPTLSAVLASPLTFTVATQNGTAVSGADYTTLNQTATITAGQLTTSVNVTVVGDAVFEATESFYVNISGATGVTPVNGNPVNPAAQVSGRVYLYNDDINQLSANTIQWIDVDGDLVTMSVSRGVLPASNADLLTFATVGTLGGRQLQTLNLQPFGATFAGTSITITASKQAGFPGVSDGRVDVGYINAAFFNADELQAFGIDLGIVKVDGDLAKITAGDSFSTPAIAKLDIYSLGMRGSDTLQAIDKPASGTVVESKVLGPITTVLVEKNVESFLHVVGSSFGTIGTLKIGGDLKGGSVDNSGRVSVSGRLATAVIGAITGGLGASSGVLSGLAISGSGASLGKVTVLGDITGGPVNPSLPSADDAFSGAIVAPKIGNVTVNNIIGGSKDRSGVIFSQSTIGNITLTGDLRGGSRANSGAITAPSNIGIVKIAGEIEGGAGADSGAIITNGNLTSLTVGAILGGSGKASGSVRAGVDNTGTIVAGGTGNIGAIIIKEATPSAANSILGGTGENSGRIDAQGNILSVTTDDDVTGGAGSGSGVIKSFARIDKITIDGSLNGADSAAANLSGSGAIIASTLRSVSITGDIKSGTKGGAGTISTSGAIRADVIDALTVSGNLVGNATNPVYITASGTVTPLAIKTVNILGNIAFADLRSGYRDTTAVSADASIGSVTIGGTVKALNIIAGAGAGTDGLFGTADDVVISGSGTINSATAVSKIASVIFKNASAIQANTTASGIVAQHIVSVKNGTSLVPLLAGAGNDIASTPTDTTPGEEIGSGTKFRAVELPLLTTT